MPNRLIHETSPYLLQHAENPVDWYAWGDEALARAQREDKPILLSIGYSACHWCHVMEHESFENRDIARLMNELFVNIKVDREERPDLDSVYMDAVQAMTGHGGWPMTVFLTPDGKPFYGGTYYPPTDRSGMPGFPKVLDAIAEAYRDRRDAVNASADKLLDSLRQNALLRPAPAVLATGLLDQAVSGLVKNYDGQHGGFGSAPKFPAPMALEFLLRTFNRTGDTQARAMVAQTLDAMARGGIYDQIGGGFHRYSVDAYWLVPHFEKMLYDNALLSRVYLLAYQVTRDAFYRRIAEETFDFVLREMTDPSGGFYSTQDADSEGEEGKFYVWTPDEVEAVVGPEVARLVERFYDITPRGNFEGKSIAHVSRPIADVAAELGLAPRQAQTLLEGARRALLAAREARVHPGRDEKVLTSWNGLMLRSFAVAARVLQREDYRQAAVRNAEFIFAHLCRGDRLLRTWKAGEAKLMGFLEDYAYVADGLLALYETTFEPRWLEAAKGLTDTMIHHFWDERGGGFFDVSDDGEQLVVRPKGYIDNATPSSNAVAADVLLRLAAYFDTEDYRQRARRILEMLAQPITRYPSAFGRTLLALDYYLGEQREVAIVGTPDAADRQALVRVVDEAYLPYVVVAAKSPDDRRAEEVVPLLADRSAVGGRATAYVCEHFACNVPTTSPEELVRQLGVSLSRDA